MGKPLIIDLGTIADISVGGTTASQKLDEQYGWSIAPTVIGTPSIAKYTVEVSQDDITFFDYKILGTDVSLEDAVEDRSINWGFIRIKVTPGGASAGSAQFSMEMKR